MCGIAGILSFDRMDHVEPRLLRAMARSMAHRGPDDEGIYLDGHVGLVHRRLSIIDRSGGRQPLANEDGSATIVFNGEIYNHVDLRDGLRARGHRFATRSDTEAIVHHYEERGLDCVRDLRGMFAFAIWDRRAQRLLLARDRLGIKPLYYTMAPGFLAFASEIKALLELPKVAPEVDREALDLYLSLRYVPAPRTMFRGIQKLEAGHVLVHDEHGLRIERYWDVPCGAISVRDTMEARQRIGDMLEESVRLRLMAEVPLGVFLSGGLDSTSVLALMRKVAPAQRPRSFTVGYAPAPGRTQGSEPANEFAYARAAADAFGSDHHELTLDADDFHEALQDIAWHLDEPVADPACVPLYFLSRMARRDITVVLSGEGADEILGGYGIYRKMLSLERLHHSLGGRLAMLSPILGRLLPSEKLRHYARLAGLPLAHRYRGVSRAFLPDLASALSGRSSAVLAGALENVFARHYAAAAGASPLQQMLYVDMKTWLADDLLVKADKMTMAHGQELRVPFLDHKLVELAAGLPMATKIKGGTGKAVLRDAMAGVVPKAILERSKKGFPVPTVSLLHRMNGFVRERLLDRGSACRSWFDPSVVERLVGEHERGRPRDQELWSLLSFELWHRAFIDRRYQPARATTSPLAPAAAAAGGA